MFGIENYCKLAVADEYYTLKDYSSDNLPRWCSGCGDHAILTAVQRLCRDEQLPPEKLAFVSGIGCSSRFPHYVNAYGFHSLHGRALPVAEGIHMRRPDLHVFVSTGDGDCCSIGTAHWIHAIRYNMKMVVMMHDNQIYALTKMQASPTSQKGLVSNTSPYGALLHELNPLTVTLGVSNVSFVAQVVEWMPDIIYPVLKEAFHHNGFAFVCILQRCPAYLPNLYDEIVKDMSKLQLLKHPNGLKLEDSVSRLFKTQLEHDPSDLNRAREIAQCTSPIPVGILYRNESVPRYEELNRPKRIFTPELKEQGLNHEFDKFAV